MTLKVISGGQTGADRGALEAAIDVGVPYGGWVPRGRRAEDGVVPARFDQLKEHRFAAYAARTRSNIEDSDATVIFAKLPLRAGSRLTADLVRDTTKPLLIQSAEQAIGDPGVCAACLTNWICAEKIEVLNVAGSRESKAPGLQAAVCKVVSIAISQVLILKAKKLA